MEGPGAGSCRRPAGRLAGRSGIACPGTASLLRLPQRPEQPVLSQDSVGRGQRPRGTQPRGPRAGVVRIQDGGGEEANVCLFCCQGQHEGNVPSLFQGGSFPQHFSDFRFANLRSRSSLESHFHYSETGQGGLEGVPQFSRTCARSWGAGLLALPGPRLFEGRSLGP